MENLGIIALLIAVVWFVIDSLRASETANNLCKQLCEAEDLQFLDQTVSLRRIRPIWGSEGIRLRRTYQFDCSRDGVERLNGQLTLVGTRLESSILPPATATYYQGKT
jgi:hypothetical protein